MMRSDSGSVEIRRAHGRWRNGRWVDFDPTKTVEPIGGTATQVGDMPPAEPHTNR